MRRGTVAMLLLLTFSLVASGILSGCKSTAKPVSAKFPEEEGMMEGTAGRTGGERGLGEGAAGEFEEGDLAIRQDQRMREMLFAKASEEMQTIYFDYDSAVLKTEAKAKLDRAAKWVKETEKVNVQIEGHCDERGTNEYNLALGERRALSARRYLISLGVNPDRIFTISYGEERPAVEGHDESAWKWNRRDEFKISF